MVKPIVHLSVRISAKGNLRRMPEIQYWDHKTYTGMRIEKIGLEQDDLPEWGFCAMERISLTRHDAIQLDAAWYYAPTSEGNPAM